MLEEYFQSIIFFILLKIILLYVLSLFSYNKKCFQINKAQGTQINWSVTGHHPLYLLRVSVLRIKSRSLCMLDKNSTTAWDYVS